MIKIELRSIKHNKANSRETYAYSARLFADGKFIALIGNDGHGGPDRVLSLPPGVSWSDYEAVAARVTAEHPKEQLLDHDPQLYDATLEGVCHQLVSDFLTARDLTRLLKSNVLFFEMGLPPEGERADLYKVKVDTKFGGTTTSIIAKLKISHPQAYILNEQAMEDAITAYKRAN